MRARHVRSLTWLVALSALACAPVAYAQTSTASGAALRELTLEELGRLEVTTVSKLPAEVWRSPAAIYVLQQEDIRRSGATTLPELLRLVPGVQVSRVDSDHWAIGVRGLTDAFSKSLLLLIDGRSAYTPLFGGVFWDAQDTPIEDIDRIEVIRGPGGTIWGANAVNGVINVITRHSRDTQSVLVSVGTGDVDEARALLRYGGRLAGSGATYRVYGGGAARAAQHHSSGLEYDDWRHGQAGFRIDSAGAGRDTLTLQGDWYVGRYGDQNAVGRFFPPAQLVVQGDDEVSGANLMARWQRDLGQGAGLRVQTYFDRTRRLAPHFGESRNTFDIDVLHHRSLTTRHLVSIGAGARVNPSNFTSRYETIAFTPEDKGHHLLSAFVQDEISIAADRAWLTVASKFEHNSDSGLEIQPSVRLLWKPTATQSVWTAVTRAVRTPSRIDTDLSLTVFAGFMNGVPIYLQATGDEDFQAENLFGVEAGYRRLIGPSLYVDVAAFHNKYSNLAGYGAGTISVETSPILHGLLSVPYINVIEGTTDGFEVSPEWRPAPWLQLRGAYAFLRAAMSADPSVGTTSDEPVARYEGSSPRHNGFISASLGLPGRLEFDHTYRFMSRLPSHDIPGYVTADARLGWPLTPSLTLAIAGHNLLQSQHPEFFPDDRPLIGIRRNVYASLTWRR